MKYDSEKNTDRDNQINRLAVRNPDLSEAELGRLFGITKQRISKILIDGGNRRREVSQKVSVSK